VRITKVRSKRFLQTARQISADAAARTAQRLSHLASPARARAAARPFPVSKPVKLHRLQDSLIVTMPC
jgi:hypothetical protein